MAGILLISGPSGAGKSTLLARLRQQREFYFSISATTRAPRAGEQNGVHYHFLSHEEFESGLARGEFLEHANVHGNFYGTPKTPIFAALAEGKSVILDIDVQGFLQVRERLEGDFTSLFISPPNEPELRRRLSERATDSADAIAKRLANAAGEIAHLAEYDFFIINDDLDASSAALLAIFDAAALRTSRADKSKFISNWKG